MVTSNTTPWYNNFLGLGNTIPRVKSLQDVNLDDEKEVLNWVKNTTTGLSPYYRNWYNMCRENVAAYAGLPYFEGMLSVGNEIPFFSARDKNSKTGYIAPIVETHVSRLTSSRANVSIMPVHSSEYKDKSESKSCEQVVRTVFVDRLVDDKLEKVARHMLVCGSAFIVAYWNTDIGPAGELGKNLGDIDYKVLNFNQIMLEPVPLEEMDWFIEIQRINKYRILDMYPFAEGKVSHDSWNPYLMTYNSTILNNTLDEAATVLTIYHKACFNFPEGLMIKCTENCILEITPLPYPQMNKMKRLPLAIIQDIVPPGQIMPIPLTIMEAAKGAQHQIDQLNKTIGRNISLSAPKWVHQRGTVTPEHLNNAAGSLPYKGTVPPVLTCPSTVNPELFEYRKLLVDTIRENTGAFETSFGQNQPNTRAGIMQEFHEEQEFKRAEPLIKKMNNLKVDLAKLALLIASDFYMETDGRQAKVLGDRTSGAFRRFKVTDLQGQFDIKIEAASNFPESKEGRLRWIQTLNEQFPGKFGWEQVKKALDFASDDDMKTPETSAYELQCLENDMLFRGEPLKAPDEWQDHFTHLKCVYPIIDSIDFSESPDEIKQGFLGHVGAHEMLLWKHALVNPQVAMRIQMELVHFPKVFTALPSAMPISANNPVPPLTMGSPGAAPVPAPIHQNNPIVNPQEDTTKV